MSRFFKVFFCIAMLAMSGCASLPNGPGVMVLPGSGLSFERFRNDDAVCQQFASFQVGGTTPNQAGVNSGVTSAVVGTALGAAAGAAIGGGQGAAIGAGTGLVAGGLVGTSAANSSMYDVQQRYDTAYIQCMYAKGHRVPVSGHIEQQSDYRQPSSSSPYPPPPPARYRPSDAPR